MRFLIRTLLTFVLVSGGSGLLCAEKTAKGKQQKQPESRQLAMVDGTPITETQARMEGATSLDSLDLQNLRAKALAERNEHQILEEAVERIIQDKLLNAEAGKQGISKDELLAKEIQQKLSEPTAEEIESFYTENKQRITIPKEEALPQISKYLKKQKESELREGLFSRLEAEHHVVRILEPLRYNVNAAGRPSRGPASAPVLLVLFSDFECPHCRRFGETMKEVLKQYGDKVRLVFRQFPLTNIHANAERAAEASLCADAQGRFWEMHDLLFQNQSSLRDEDLKSRASKLGLDVAAFNSCLDSKRYGGSINEDVRAASAAGVEGTPALFINGRFLYGSRSKEEVTEIIDEELAKKSTSASQQKGDGKK
jgi:predicted DsbA family dithiol-disulfide isomerase